MTAEGRTLREAIQAHRESLNSLLTHTITLMPLIAVIDRPTGHVTISFRRGGAASAATIPSRFGPLDLFLLQALDAIEGQRERVRLRMLEYQYTIAPADADEPLFRWEYVRFPTSGSFWCRNHLQGPIALDFGGRSVNLNDWHLPTGPVPIEEIIRFCVVDLGVPPLDASIDADGAPGWHRRLNENPQRDPASIDA